jgi:hypothetical protein
MRTRSILPTLTLAALAATFVPGLCTADCLALMDCCRKGPATASTLSPASCCAAERPQVSVPTTMVAEIGSKLVRASSGPAPFSKVAAEVERVTFDALASDQPPRHRAPGVPLYLLNTAVLC